MLDVIKSSLWNKKDLLYVDQDVFEEMKKHAVYLLSASNISNIIMPDELRKTWEMQIIQGIAYNTKCRYAQSMLPITVPYTILKGTTAAQYYPFPQYRLLGDIDIITKPSDYHTACEMLLKNGYKEINHHFFDDNERHRCFIKNDIVVEVHYYFAILNDPEKAEFLDHLIIENINMSHTLPDQINGLVLLEHISQHLEDGLGLRQIIDWMMFVNSCLSDEEWKGFQPLCKKVGLEKLAVTTTRMCEIYLGLTERKWSTDADGALCRELMDYILSCGNFGSKRVNDSDIVQHIFSRARSAKATFRLLQERGLTNWKAAQKNILIRPFAWIYQIGRYLQKGCSRDDAILKLSSDYKIAKKRKRMFDALGVKQFSKKVAVFQDGRYIRK